MQVNCVCAPTRTCACSKSFSKSIRPCYLLKYFLLTLNNLLLLKHNSLMRFIINCPLSVFVDEGDRLCANLFLVPQQMSIDHFSCVFTIGWFIPVHRGCNVSVSSPLVINKIDTVKLFYFYRTFSCCEFSVMVTSPAPEKLTQL